MARKRIKELLFPGGIPGTTLISQAPPTPSFVGFMDTFVAPYVAVYSLKRATGSYSGPLIRVRRSSDNAEADIFYDSNGNLDEIALLNHVGGSSGWVTKWYNQVAGGEDLSNTVLTGQPLIVDNGVVVRIRDGFSSPAMRRANNNSNNFITNTGVNAFSDPIGKAHVQFVTGSVSGYTSPTAASNSDFTNLALIASPSIVSSITLIRQIMATDAIGATISAQRSFFVANSPSGTVGDTYTLTTLTNSLPQINQLSTTQYGQYSSGSSFVRFAYYKESDPLSISSEFNFNSTMLTNIYNDYFIRLPIGAAGISNQFWSEYILINTAQTAQFNLDLMTNRAQAHV